MAVASGLAARSQAEACSPDPCYDSNRFSSFDLAVERIKPDGVLVFRPYRNAGGLPLAEALDYVDVQVLGPDGVALEGALEAFSESVALWRPASAMLPDTTYSVLVHVDNETLGLDNDPEWVNEEGFCGENIDIDTAVDSTSGSFASLELTTSASQEVQHSTILDLHTLVCCDGAMPREEFWCGDIPDLYWEEGFCTSDAQLGRLTGTFDAEPAVSPEGGDLENLMIRLHTGSDVRSAFPGDLSIGRTAEEPFCSTVELVNIATGESVMGPEHCVGEDVADQLGELTVDPSAPLGQECVGEPYVCMVEGDAWDPDACTPWTEPDDGTGSGGDDGDGDGDGDGGSGDSGDPGLNDDGIADRGCSCRTDSRSGPWGMAWSLLGLALLRRRWRD